MQTSFTVLGSPVPKPRMTRSDKWKERPAVVRYRAWADDCRQAATGSPLTHVEADVLGVYAFFHLPLPESLPEGKKQALYGRLHRSRCDADNMAKGLIDALFAQDKQIAVVQAVKFWVEEGASPRTDVFLLVA